MLLGKAQRVKETYDLAPDIGELPNKKPKTRIELTKKRTRHSTRFANPDGSFTEEIYLEPQFFEDVTDKKKWKKIDNTLKKSLKKLNRYENTANAFSVFLADDADTVNLLSLQKEGFEIEMLLQTSEKAKGKVRGNEIVYSDLLPNVDVSFAVSSEGVKESLILKTSAVQTQFTFALLLPANLRLAEELNGNIGVYSPSGEQLWILEKPFMVDANGTISNDAALQIRTQENQTYIDMVLSQDFLRDPATAYPIVVDPSIQSPLSIRDTFISNRYPQNVYASMAYMFTGATPSYGVTRSLVQFALPPLPGNSRITQAAFQAYQTNTNTLNMTVDLFRISSAWSDSVTWNSQPAIASSSESSTAPNTANAFWNWDITRLAQDWYNGLHANYGILLKNRDEAAAPYGFFTTKETRAEFHPRLSITYFVEAIGKEDHYHLTEEGVNPSNGNFTFTESDFVLQGRGIPIAISRTYNSRNAAERGLFGNGWTSDWDVRLTYAASGPAIFTDRDGSKHIFGESPGGGYISSNDTHMQLTKQTDGTFLLIMEDTTRLTFNQNGRILTMTDAINNRTVFSYSPSGQLQSITDASQRSATITFGSTGFISTISIENRTYRYSQDAYGNLTSFTNARSSVKTYGYDGMNRLVTIKNARNIVTTLTYDIANRLSKYSRPLTVRGTATTSNVTYIYDPATSWTTRYDNQARRTDYSYDPLARMTQIIENINDPVLKKVTKYEYNLNNDIVLIQDPKNLPYVYGYDDQGNVVYEELPEQQRAYYTYDNQNNLIKEQDFNQNVSLHDYDINNNEIETIDPYVQSVSKRYDEVGNLLYQTNPLSVSDNLLPNSSFEYGTNWPDFWKTYSKAGSTAQFAWASVSRFGNRSVSISNPTAGAMIYCDGLIPFSAGTIYVVSGYVKTMSTTGKAYIKVEFLGTSSNWLGQKTSYALLGTHDWTRLQTLIDIAPVGTAFLRISGWMDAGQGMAYFDALQAEIGNVVSAYNLIENSSFERYHSTTDKIPLFWSTSGNLAAEDGRVQNVSPTDTHVYVGNYAFKLTGEKGKNKHIRQRIPLSGEANTKLTLSGWSYQEGADPAGGYYLMQVYILYTDGTEDWRFSNDFGKTTFGWQHISAEIETAKAFQAIDVYLYFYNQTGAAWFDGMRLEIGPSHTSYFYDERKNFVTAIEDPLGRTVFQTQDLYGNLTSLTNGSGNKTSYSYNQENELTAVTDAKGQVTSYQYDGEGNLADVTNARGAKTSFQYNEDNNVTRRIDALNRATAFEYDQYSNLTKTVNPNNTTVSFVYDSLNRLVSKAYNNVKQHDLEYDLNDNISKVMQFNGPVTSFSYDSNNRLISEAEGIHKTSYGYDSNFNVTSIAISGAGKTSFAYNELDQLRSIFKDDSLIANYMYQENGQLASVYFTNGTYAAFEYNGANQLIKLTNYTVNGTIMEQYVYTYTTSGNISSIGTTKGTIRYQYDSLSQLTQETLLDGTMISYEYDSVGNRIKKTVTKGVASTITLYTFDAEHQILTENNQPFVYDANGNLVDDGKNSYRFNANNQLIEVKDIATGNTIASFTYDFQNRRKTITTINGTVNFHYDQRDNVIYETDSSGTVTVEYTWDHENRPVTMLKNGFTYYYSLNGHGDVIALTDKDGNNMASYTYDAWGNIISKTGLLADSNPYRYAGYRYEQETGLYYLMARYYDPFTARFISRDAYSGDLEKPISQHAYLYAGNNPIINKDPDGNVAIVLVPLGVIAIEAGLLASGMYLIYHMNMQADEIIQKKKKGSIRSEFPKEMLDKTLNEIEKLARKGNKIAKKAKKLLTDKRFDKGDNRK